MARIGPSRDTRPERVVRMWLVRHRVRHRRNFRELPGSPDFYLPRHRLAVFVDGRFWHDPRSRAVRISAFWSRKIEVNVRRDRRVRRRLRIRLGLRTHRIWDTDLTRRKLAWQLRLRRVLQAAVS